MPAQLHFDIRYSVVVVGWGLPHHYFCANLNFIIRYSLFDIRYSFRPPPSVPRPSSAVRPPSGVYPELVEGSSVVRLCHCERGAAERGNLMFSSFEFVIRFYRKQLSRITTSSAGVKSCFYIYGGFGEGNVPR